MCFIKLEVLLAIIHNNYEYMTHSILINVNTANLFLFSDLFILWHEIHLQYAYWLSKVRTDPTRRCAVNRVIAVETRP